MSKCQHGMMRHECYDCNEHKIPQYTEAELQEKLRQQREACAEAAEDAGYWLNDELIMPDDIGETVRNAKID